MLSFSTMDHRRRRAALRFLNSISLDNQPVIKDGEHRGESRHGAGLSASRQDAASKTTTENPTQCGPSADAEEESGYLAAEAVIPGCSSVAHCSGALRQTSHSTCMQIGPSREFVVEMQRCSAGSPEPKSCKKVHFIKNMRQHDTRNGRDRRHLSHSGMGTRENAIGLEGVELGGEGKTVSYSDLLFSTYVFCYPIPKTRPRPRPPYSQGHIRGVHFHRKRGIKAQDYVEYDPNLLGDPQWPCGKHKRVLVFQSYMTTVIEYVKPSDLKRDMNETFGEKFPHVRLTLSKIRSLKREIRKLAQEDCGYEEPTVAMAFVYFEKLALRAKLNKQNRKLCAGACILLAAKIGSDLKRPEVKNLIDRLEEKFRLNRKDLLAIEFPVFVALEFELHLPQHVLQPHYRCLQLNS